MGQLSFPVPVHPISLSWFLRQYHLHATALTEMAGLKTGADVSCLEKLCAERFAEMLERPV